MEPRSPVQQPSSTTRLKCHPFSIAELSAFPSSRDPVPSSRRPSTAHTVLSVKHSPDLQRTPSRGRKAPRLRSRQRCGATKTDTGNCRQGSQEQLHRPEAGCRIDRRLLRIDRGNRRSNCSCVSSIPSWHGRALRRRHLAPSVVVAQRRTVGSDDEIKRFIRNRT